MHEASRAARGSDGGADAAIRDVRRVPRGVRIGHPSGVALVAAEVSGGEQPHAERAVVYRTARRLMDGFVYAPAR